jgi:catechol 2,3-dioxygenase-like lactoylglutathione lyase family enzyme
MSPLTRRSFLLSAAALPVMAQSTKPALAARKLHQMTLTVTDLKRSLDFYRGLFGMPIQARSEGTAFLRVGAGPQYLALIDGGASAKAGYSHYGISIDGFNATRVMQTLADHGVTPGGEGAGLSGGPMKARMVTRGQTPEVYLGDPDGIVIQVQDTSYCGGAGVLGGNCLIEDLHPKGVFALRDLSHFTLFGSNAERAQTFYREIFGMYVQAHQAPAGSEASPVLGVAKGSGGQFIMAAGAGGRGGGAGGSINHGCFLMDGFNVDRVLKALEEYGVKPRGNSGGTPPLVSYVSMRMENRGGAKEGTAELYFTDPDGILMQLQDPTYCGGGGVLGEICPGGR